MLIIGESINGTIEKVGQAIMERNEDFIASLARTQVECGAEALDINAGVAGGNEEEDLSWVLGVVQGSVSVPLMIDSPNPKAIEAALSIYKGDEVPIINSVSAEEGKVESLLPLITARPSKVVALCMDSSGIPKTMEERVENGRALFLTLTKAGVSPSDIFFDVLLLSVAVQADAILIGLDTTRHLKGLFPECHFVGAMSNVSMSLPGRRLLNRTFLTMAISHGFDALLVDVRDRSLMSSVYAGKLLMNQDPYCLDYIKHYREKRLIV
jgi:cobalamin-dependent methionine synthase I